MRDDLDPPRVGILGRRETCLGVGDPSGRDVIAGNSQVLEGIGIGLLGKIAMECQVRIWIGVAMLVLRRMAATVS